MNPLDVEGPQAFVHERFELVAGDSVEVWTRLVEVRDKVMRLVHTMHNVETGETSGFFNLNQNQ